MANLLATSSPAEKANKSEGEKAIPERERQREAEKHVWPCFFYLVLKGKFMQKRGRIAENTHNARNARKMKCN